MTPAEVVIASALVAIIVAVAYCLGYGRGCRDGAVVTARMATERIECLAEGREWSPLDFAAPLAGTGTETAR